MGTTHHESNRSLGLSSSASDSSWTISSSFRTSSPCALRDLRPRGTMSLRSFGSKSRGTTMARHSDAKILIWIFKNVFLQILSPLGVGPLYWTELLELEEEESDSASLTGAALSASGIRGIKIVGKHLAHELLSPQVPPPCTECHYRLLVPLKLLSPQVPLPACYNEFWGGF